MRRTGLLRGAGTPEERRAAVARADEWRRQAAARWEAKRRRARFTRRTALRRSRGVAGMSPERREDEQRRQSAYSVVARRAGGLCEAQVSGVCSGGLFAESGGYAVLAAEEAA